MPFKRHRRNTQTGHCHLGHDLGMGHYGAAASAIYSLATFNALRWLHFPISGERPGVEPPPRFQKLWERRGDQSNDCAPLGRVEDRLALEHIATAMAVSTRETMAARSILLSFKPQDAVKRVGQGGEGGPPLANTTGASNRPSRLLQARVLRQGATTRDGGDPGAFGSWRAARSPPAPATTHDFNVWRHRASKRCDVEEASSSDHNRQQSQRQQLPEAQQPKNLAIKRTNADKAGQIRKHKRASRRESRAEPSRRLGISVINGPASPKGPPGQRQHASSTVGSQRCGRIVSDVGRLSSCRDVAGTQGAWINGARPAAADRHPGRPGWTAVAARRPWPGHRTESRGLAHGMPLPRPSHWPATYHGTRPSPSHEPPQ